MLYAEWLSRRAIKTEEILNVGSPLHRPPGKSSICLNDLKSQLQQILEKLQIADDSTILTMLDILNKSMNRQLKLSKSW